MASPWPRIETARLVIRPMTIDDVDAVYALRSNPQVFSWRKPDTRAQTLEWVESHLADPAGVSYCVSPKDSPENVVGAVGAAHLPEIGYCYDPAVWGKGYATEALKGWIEMFWSNYPNGHPSLKENQRGFLIAQTGPEDQKSPNVLKKCGFRYVGLVETEDHGPVEVGEQRPKVMLDEWKYEKAGAP